MLFRTIETSDIEDVVAFWSLAGLLRPWNDPYRDIAFARDSANATIILACEAEQLVGTAMIGHDGHRGWLYYVATHPDWRGQGIGRQLMQQAEQWLARQGVWKVQLLVRGDNAQAAGFYQTLGYRDTGSVCLQKVIEPIA